MQKPFNHHFVVRSSRDDSSTHVLQLEHSHRTMYVSSIRTIIPFYVIYMHIYTYILSKNYQTVSVASLMSITFWRNPEGRMHATA